VHTAVVNRRNRSILTVGFNHEIAPGQENIDFIPTDAALVRRRSLPPDPDLARLLDEKDANYRREGRENDATNADGVICFTSRSRQTLARCATSLTTRANAHPGLTTDLGGYVRTTHNLSDLYHFVIHESGQAAKNWGESLSLGRRGDLNKLCNHRILRSCGNALFRRLQTSTETSLQTGLTGIIQAIQAVAGWNSGDLDCEEHIFAGGHIVYSGCENDQNSTVPAAIGSAVDVIYRSPDRSRRVVQETKREGEIKGAYDGCALIQMLTGCLGLGAQVGLIAAGTSFGVYWFKYVNSKDIHMYKLLPSDQLLQLRTADELITFLAHIAFFVSEPITTLDTDSRSQMEERSASRSMRSATAGPNSATTSRLANASRARSTTRTRSVRSTTDVWDEVFIRGERDDCSLKCVRLREDLDRATCQAITGELEKILSDDE
jgi:hypothetical protein